MRSDSEVAKIEKWLDRPTWARAYDPREGVSFHVFASFIQSALVGVVGGAVGGAYFGWDSRVADPGEVMPVALAFAAFWLPLAFYYYVIVAHVVYPRPRGTLFDNTSRGIDEAYQFEAKKPHTTWNDIFSAEDRRLARTAYVNLLGATHHDEIEDAREAWDRMVNLLAMKRSKERELAALQPTPITTAEHIVRDHIQDLSRSINEQRKALVP